MNANIHLSRCICLVEILNIIKYKLLGALMVRANIYKHIIRFGLHFVPRVRHEQRAHKVQGDGKCWQSKRIYKSLFTGMSLLGHLKPIILHRITSESDFTANTHGSGVIFAGFSTVDNSMVWQRCLRSVQRFR